MNRLKANWELGFFLSPKCWSGKRERKQSSTSVYSHGFSTETKFPVLAVYYFSVYRESVPALLLWGFISTANLDYPSIEWLLCRTAAAQRINYHLIAQAIQSDQPEGRMRSPKLMQRSDAAAMDEVPCRAASFPYGGGRWGPTFYRGCLRGREADMLQRNSTTADHARRADCPDPCHRRLSRRTGTARTRVLGRCAMGLGRRKGLMEGR